MSHGRHAAPAEHHLARNVAGVTAAATLATGGLMAITPAQAQADREAQASVDTDTQPMAVTAPVPETAAVTATSPRRVVQSGDTLSGIGAAVGEPWQTLYADNRATVGPNPNLIRAGQTLLLDPGPPTVPMTVPAPRPAAPRPAAVPGPATVPMAPPAPPAPVVPAASVGRHATVDGQDVVNEARLQLGKPYVWAAAGPNAFDCSGLVVYVFKQLGIAVPHSAQMQSHLGTLVPEAGYRGLANAQPGDLVFFDVPDWHVGIYVGGGQMIAAPQTGEVVKQQAVYATPVSIRRLV